MNFAEKFGNDIVALSVAIQISQDDAQAFYDREKELFGHPVLRGESILQPVDDVFTCDRHSNELIDTVPNPTPSQVRKALLRDRKEVQKQRDIDRRQKRATKRHQAY